MPEQVDVQIQTVFCEVLKNLAFMFGDRVERDELPADVDGCIEASVEYVGPSSGTLTLVAPKAVAGELAANVLGIDVDDNESGELALDAIGELMNVTVGRLLTTLCGDEPIFDLSPPFVRDVDSDRWQQMIEQPETVAILVEESPVLLQLHTTSTNADH